MKTSHIEPKTEYTLIGAGIMSATLGVILKQLDPGATIRIYEVLDKVADESSNSWNNAGTGHSAFCELNYTPEQKDGSINIDKALNIASDFEESRQFWAYIKERFMPNHPDFIRNVPHMSFVWGEKNISFLKRRYDTMVQHGFFKGMEYSEDFDQIAKWIPLMMNNRDRNQKMAVTKMDIGTDVNFDSIARGLIEHLKKQEGVEVFMSHQVKDLKQKSDKSWMVKVKNLTSGEKHVINSNFIFIGAGGGSLPLLQKSGIKEGKGYGGFPVSGLFLKCTNKEVVDKHYAKVYGKAATGSPPMSMPHLDARVIDGEKSLLFGPYAGSSTKFLKNGSFWDLFGSVRLHNIWPMLAAGLRNIPLIKYLFGQIFLTPKDRYEKLLEYYPNARMEDWELIVAGQRVQIMKKDKKQGGVLKLGTELIHSEDGTLAALLGASPGASTSVSIMLEVLEKCFPEKMNSVEWKEKVSEMVPTYGKDLANDPELIKQARKSTEEKLGLFTRKEEYSV